MFSKIVNFCDRNFLVWQGNIQKGSLFLAGLKKEQIDIQRIIHKEFIVEMARLIGLRGNIGCFLRADG